MATATTWRVVTSTAIPFSQQPKRGKVRDIYDLGGELLIVATDRISAFDVVLPQGIPGKGFVLTQISKFWFDYTRDIVPNHLISTELEDFPAEFRPYGEVLEGRSMLVKKAKPLPIECIVRGYLTGSGWKEYKESGSVCGITLPKGLRESDRLPEPIFTPSTKAEIGEHDVNITFEKTAELVGAELAQEVKRLSIEIYNKALSHALEKGIIIADTKFEFGIRDDGLILIDELLTPDSSRFWPLDDYEPGRAQKSFDKQFVRDYLESVGWNKKPPAPDLPQDIIDKTSEKYFEALRRLRGY
ncbi:MAG: phosphoribosylaminoimidazolesuccinocarboxamide synthase [Candidatus Methanosuratincola sp.]|jgi:phosphoribosylaminoimidazole-succinocarboxamide synthase